MGKHDVTEAVPRINANLEQHYKDEIKRLKECIVEAGNLLEDAKRQMENYRFQLSMKDAEIETLRTALIDTMIEKTEAKHV